MFNPDFIPSDELVEQACNMADVLAFEDGRFKRHTKAKFVGKTMQELLNNIDEGEML